MLNDNRKTLATLENGIDMILNLAAMLMAYVFAVLIKEPVGSGLDSPYTMLFIFAVVIMQSFFFISMNMYRQISFERRYVLFMSILRANLIFFLICELYVYVFFEGAKQEFTVIWLLIGGIISTALLLFKKNLLIFIVGKINRRRYNLRKVIIVGDNSTTITEFVRQVSLNSQCGMMIIGYVGDRVHDVGCKKLGSFRELDSVLGEYHPTDVIFAVDAYDKRHIIKLVNLCDDRCIRVYFLPVIFGFFKSARQLSSIGSMPIINVHTNPLDRRFNAFVKRTIDILGSLFLIVLTSPIMLVTAIGVYISSPGPIFFKQERLGKMGKPFVMYKFRSMRVNADSDAAWTSDEDPRKTRFGNFIRKTSIDELPQLFNVFFGSMSLVGPRPEIPKFVEHFKEIIPLYMVKHYVKPGMTGLAQIKGLRGDTSVEDRIHEDIEYIENWSLALDILILLKTPFKAINKHERYEKKEDEVKTNECACESSEPVAAVEEAICEAPKKKSRGKILYAASTMSHINNFHLGYIDALRADGYEVQVMARGDGADYNMPFEKKMFSPSNTACRAEIKRIAEREQFDFVILNTTLAAFHIRRALPKKNRPWIVNIVHGYLFSERSRSIKSLLLLLCEKWLAKKTDSIIVMNREDERIARRHKLCRGRVIYSKGMGATVREAVREPEAVRRELMCQDKFVMTFVGELSARKNQEFLISAMMEVKERIPSAVLWLVGDGIAKDELTALAKRTDLSESVFFLGHRDDACDLMRASDLYVSASSIEGMPFNIIEAMGCGKTVLASRVKGHTDLIEDGVSGFLYKQGSTREFADKVYRIYSGEYIVEPRHVLERYREFANENVFAKTLKALREAMR